MFCMITSRSTKGKHSLGAKFFPYHPNWSQTKRSVESSSETQKANYFENPTQENTKNSAPEAEKCTKKVFGGFQRSENEATKPLANKIRRTVTLCGQSRICVSPPSFNETCWLVIEWRYLPAWVHLKQEKKVTTVSCPIGYIKFNSIYNVWTELRHQLGNLFVPYQPWQLGVLVVQQSCSRCITCETSFH